MGVEQGGIVLGWYDPKVAGRIAGLSVIDMPWFDAVWWFEYRLLKNGWCLRVPLWFVTMIITCPTIFAWWLDFLAHRREKMNSCPSCSYPRAGLAPSSPCPECGAPGVTSP